MTVLGQDNFNRTVAGSWGTASDGQTWARVAGTDTPSVDGSVGKITSPVSATLTVMLLGALTSIDFDIRTKVQVTTFTENAGIVARSTASNTYYRCYLDNSVLRIGKVVSGTETSIATGSFSVSSATWYHIRFRGRGSLLFGKVWLDGSAEPGTWTAQGTDSTIIATGKHGLFSLLSAVSVAQFDDFFANDYESGAISLLTVTQSATTTQSVAGIVGESVLLSFDAALGTTTGEQTAESLLTFTTTENHLPEDVVVRGDSLLTFDATSAMNGEQTAEFILATPNASGNAMAALILPPAQVSVKIADVFHEIKEDSFSIEEAAGERSVCTFLVRDANGTLHFTKGQQVEVHHSFLGLLFAGIINDVSPVNVYPNAFNWHHIRCVDNTWFAEKRLVTSPNSRNRFAGDVVVSDLLPQLAAEGIVANYASRRDTTAPQFAQGTLTNTIATTNVEDGCLELASAGSLLSGTLPDTVLTTSPALRFKGTANVPGATDLYIYRRIWKGTVTLATNDLFSYEIWMSGASPEAKAGVDLIFGDGTFYRKFPIPSTGTDNQDIGPNPANDLQGLATNVWYFRPFRIPSALNGKVVRAVIVGLEGDKVGEYTAYFKNIKLETSGGSPKATFFSSVIQSQPTKLISNTGYANVLLDVVDTYNNSQVLHQAVSLTSVGIVRSSLIVWEEDIPQGATVDVLSSIDGGAVFARCQNTKAIPLVLPGLPVTGKSVTFITRVLVGGDHPTIAPILKNITHQITPASNGTNTDLMRIFTSQADFLTGTLFETEATADDRLILDGGGFRDFAGGDLSDIAGFGNGSGLVGIANRTLFLETAATSFISTRHGYLGTNHNFTVEANIKVPGSGAIGILYRTTSWTGTNNTYAFAATLSTTTLSLDRGSNAAANTKVNVGSAVVTLNADEWHRIEVVVEDDHHQVFLDDVLLIDVIHATFSGLSGQVGIYYNNTSGAKARGFADAIGMVDVLTGTWTSPSISLATIPNYGASVVSASQSVPDTTSILLETSINGGSTWLPVVSGGQVGGLTPGQSLSGISVLLRATLTAANATVQPAVNVLRLLMIGQFSATGTRVAPVLSLSPVGRAGSSLVAWNALTPAGTSLVVEVSADSSNWTNVTGNNGGEIPFITSQPDPDTDTFEADSSAGYTSLSRSDGAPASWTWDTPNKRLTVSGGREAILTFNANTTFLDGEVSIDSDQADQGGMVLRYQDANNYYDLALYDSMSSLVQNYMQLFRVSGSIRTLLTATPISFVRGTFRRIKAVTRGSIITVSIDSAQALFYSDASPLLSAGKVGLRAGYPSSAGTSHYNQLRIQNYGEDCTGQNVFSRLTLTSTNPTQNPQVADLTISAYHPEIGRGVLIPETDYAFKSYADQAIDDLAKKSDYWWNITHEKRLLFQARTGQPASWILSSSSGDLLVKGLRVKNTADTYRNRQWVRGAIDTDTFVEILPGDGIVSSWALGYPVAAPPSIIINDLPASVGVKGIDTQKTYYYEIGSSTIALDSSVTPPITPATITYLGSFETTVMREDAAAIAAFALKEGGSGIVERVINVSDQNMSKAAAEQLAQAELDRNLVIGHEIIFKTRKHGLAPGQLLPVFIPEHGLQDALMLINRIETFLRSATIDGVQQMRSEYTIEASEGPNLGSWLKVLKK